MRPAGQLSSFRRAPSAAFHWPHGTRLDALPADLQEQLPQPPFLIVISRDPANQAVLLQLPCNHRLRLPAWSLRADKDLSINKLLKDAFSRRW